MPDSVNKAGVLLLLPHHDDEFFMMKGIWDRIRGGQTIVVVYLTFGSIYGASSAQRLKESTRALKWIGVPAENVHQVGIEQDIFDGLLHTRLHDAFLAVECIIRNREFTEICVPAWEGGHQDHDSAHYLGTTVVRKLLPTAELREFPIYTAYKRPAPFFSVMRLIPRDGRADSTPVSVPERMKMLRAISFYHSQWKTFMGLLPGILTRVLIRGALETRRVTGIDYQNRPHAGALYYERRFGIHFNDIKRAVESLDAALLTR